MGRVVIDYNEQKALAMRLMDEAYEEFKVARGPEATVKALEKLTREHSWVEVSEQYQRDEEQRLAKNAKERERRAKAKD